MTPASRTLAAPLMGIIPPLATPLRSPEQLDCEGLERLVEHVIAGGVRGIFALGTTGEGPMLPLALRRQLVERVAQQAGFRVPILVGISDASLAESVAQAEHAAAAGAHAVVAAPPFYLSQDQDELRRHMTELARRVPLPLFLYNMPALTKTAFELETVRALMEVDSIVGVKDSSGNLIAFHQLCQLSRDRADWSVLMGPEELVGDAVLAGGHGGVCGGANLHPELYVRLYEAAAAGDLPQVQLLREEVFRLARIYRVASGGSSILRGLKAALAYAGICGGGLTSPIAPLEGDQLREVHRLVDQLRSVEHSPLPLAAACT